MIRSAGLALLCHQHVEIPNMSLLKLIARVPEFYSPTACFFTDKARLCQTDSSYLGLVSLAMGTQNVPRH